MPDVKTTIKKKFPYTTEGIAAAKAYAKRTGGKLTFSASELAKAKKMMKNKKRTIRPTWRY